MALGKMSKAEVKKYRDYEDKLKGHIEALGQFSKMIVTSKKAFDGVVAKAGGEYAKSLGVLDAFAAWISGVAQEQRDAYEEKAGESERWAASDRASQVESWVDALEMASNIEEIPRALVFDPAETIWYAGVRKMPTSTWDIDGEVQGGIPTSFPAYVEPFFDYYELQNAVESMDSLPIEDGADYY
jgi:hypothetical protein